MHFVPVDPGLRFVALNRAEFESSSDRLTVPADQLFVGFEVVDENAEYEACQTISAEPSRPAATVATPTIFAWREDGRTRVGAAWSDMVGCSFRCGVATKRVPRGARSPVTDPPR